MMDGLHYKKGILLARDLLEREMEFINAINVYPVADADTGSNMFLTMDGIAATIRDVDTRHFGEVAMAVADAALEHARGNSGTILSQYFWGITEAVGDKETLDRHDVVNALVTAKDWAYQAVSNPVEGTILTVMRETAEAAQRLAKSIESVPELLYKVYQEALRALERTPELLAKMGKPKIIDSGAYGFTLLLEGFVNGLGVDVAGYRVRGMRAEREQGNGDSGLFCTTYMLEPRGSVLTADIRRAIEKYGDSIVVVGGGKRVKVHIHTEDPEAVRKALEPYGEIVQKRIDRIW